MASPRKACSLVWFFKSTCSQIMCKIFACPQRPCEHLERLGQAMIVSARHGNQANGLTWGTSLLVLTNFSHC